jgi:hypothetical protein
LDRENINLFLYEEITKRSLGCRDIVSQKASDHLSRALQVTLDKQCDILIAYIIEGEEDDWCELSLFCPLVILSRQN